MNELYEVTDGKLRLQLHPGQTKAWDSRARFTWVIAGTQSGKSVFGPWWLWREWQERGKGDYLVVAPTYPLLQKKVLPEFLRVWRRTLRLGEYRKADKIFDVEDGSQVFFGHASDPDSLESATGKGAWLDECGQDKFKLSSWEAIQRRLSIHQGRVLGTTTPYNLGWLKTQVYDRWVAGDKDYRVIQFKSIQNPAFPRAEYERAERTLPAWKFAMFYRGEFTRPAGMIYDCFDFERHVIEPFDIPRHWARYGGLDFGGVNTAALAVAKDPDTGALYLYAEYHHGGRTAAEHAAALKPWGVSVWYGGAKSEGQWRQEFRAAGMPVGEPAAADVDVGIDRVYGRHKSDNYYVFKTCVGYLDEKGRYSRELDDNGEPTEKIKDKQTFHRMDAERYLIGSLDTTASWNSIRELGAVEDYVSPFA